VRWETDEGISGARGLDKRPGLAAAFEACQRTRRGPGRIDGIVAFDRSRFSRDRNLAGMLRWTAQQGGFALLAVDGLDTRDDSASAAATDFVSDFTNEQARQAIRRATRAAMAARRDSGLVTGHIPYGYTRDGSRLAPLTTELSTLREAQRLRESGLSLRRVADALNGQGMVGRRGPWSATSVRRVLSGRGSREL
jgi:DNA invertase Pin-like site-specific DNA recombinase